MKSFDAAKAKAVPGVQAVFQVPSGVAVVADHFWAAKRGRDALEIDGTWAPAPALDTDAMLRREYRALARQPGARGGARGRRRAALAGAAPMVEAEYEVPYLAHAPMEPLNCTVEARGRRLRDLDRRRSSRPSTRASAARSSACKPEQVKIHTTFLGGGFGRRATPTSDFVVEAVEVAKAVEARR